MNFNVLEITELRGHGRWQIFMIMTTSPMLTPSYDWMIRVVKVQFMMYSLIPLSRLGILVRIVSFPCHWRSYYFKIRGIADTCFHFTVPSSLDPMLLRCSWFYLWLSVLFGVDEGATSRVEIKSVSFQDSVQGSGLCASRYLLY